MPAAGVIFQSQAAGTRPFLVSAGAWRQVKQGGRIWQQRDQVRGIRSGSGAAESRVATEEATEEVAGGGWTQAASEGLSALGAHER